MPVVKHILVKCSHLSRLDFQRETEFWNKKFIQKLKSNLLPHLQSTEKFIGTAHTFWGF